MWGGGGGAWPPGPPGPPCLTPLTTNNQSTTTNKIIRKFVSSLIELNRYRQISSEFKTLKIVSISQEKKEYLTPSTVPSAVVYCS